MVEIERLTGMRPGEVCQMRTRDLDTSGKVWVYTAGSHKTEHHDRERKIYLGPRAQAALRTWLKPDLAAFLFSPREAMEERWTEQCRNRKTPLTPSQQSRTRKRKPKKTPGERYTPDSYRQAIVKGCEKADVPAWHPHQLRHNAATWLRKEFGLDVARVILGHSSPAVTEIYAEEDRDKAVAIMEQVG
jgi:integrase